MVIHIPVADINYVGRSSQLDYYRKQKRKNMSEFGLFLNHTVGLYLVVMFVFSLLLCFCISSCLKMFSLSLSLPGVCCSGVLLDSPPSSPLADSSLFLLK